MQQAIEENDTTGLFVTHHPCYDSLYICVCECTPISALYMRIYVVMCSFFSYVFLWAEDGIKSSRELHNPINSYSGEVIYLI